MLGSTTFLNVSYFEALRRMTLEWSSIYKTFEL
jgi:hypothetical protein